MTAHRLRLRRDLQRRHRQGGTLNLVSLMDIFTILVFFLLVNSSEVEVLQSSNNIKLPDSMAEQAPENRLIIMVSQEDVLVQGRRVAEIANLRPSDDGLIAGLKDELSHQAGRRRQMPEGGYEITIMGDREIPYWLLKRIMMTCQETDFAQISLAVNRIAGAEPVPDLSARPLAAPDSGGGA